MLDALRTGTGDTVILLGHNPGIAEFAEMILANAPKQSDFRRFPTAATMIATLPINDWPQADWYRGQLVDFIVPRALGIS